MSQLLWNRKMISAFAGVLIILLTITSCKKEKDPGGSDSGYYVKFKANGTQIIYKAYAEGNFNKLASGKYVSTLSGLNEAFVATKSNMSIGLSTVDQNAVNITYTNYAVSSSAMQKAVVLSLGYYDDKGVFFMTWSDEFAPALPDDVETVATCIFTEQTEDHLKGNFTGKMYNEDFSVKLDITDGEFFVKRVR